MKYIPNTLRNTIPGLLGDLIGFKTIYFPSMVDKVCKPEYKTQQPERGNLVLNELCNLYLIHIRFAGFFSHTIRKIVQEFTRVRKSSVLTKIPLIDKEYYSTASISLK